jgi:hypothetical protein
MRIRGALGLLLCALSFAACGNDVEADRLGVGAQCTDSDQCDGTTDQVCLTQFSGGYCGIEGCDADADCPEGAACIHHDDDVNYCFRICVDKPDCNENRDVENEANCSSSAEFVEGADGRKACVPPSSGI